MTLVSEVKLSRQNMFLRKFWCNFLQRQKNKLLDRERKSFFQTEDRKRWKILEERSERSEPGDTWIVIRKETPPKKDLVFVCELRSRLFSRIHCFISSGIVIKSDDEYQIWRETVQWKQCMREGGDHSCTHDHCVNYIGLSDFCLHHRHHYHHHYRHLRRKKSEVIFQRIRWLSKC